MNTKEFNLRSTKNYGTIAAAKEAIAARLALYQISDTDVQVFIVAQDGAALGKELRFIPVVQLRSDAAVHFAQLIAAAGFYVFN